MSVQDIDFETILHTSTDCALNQNQVQCQTFQGHDALHTISAQILALCSHT